MRFLFIIDALETGGAERMVLSLAERLLQTGHEVNLLALKNSVDLDVPEGVKLHILDYKKTGFIPYNLLYAFLLRRRVASLVSDGGQFDLIACNLNLSYRLVHLARLKGVYYCIHESVSDSSLSARKGLKKFFRRRRFQRILNDKDVITVSVGIEDDLLNVVKIRPSSIRTIYNGVNFSRILSMAELYEHDIKADYLVHVGRLNRVKRHDILLRAFKKSQLDCKLVLVGEGPEKNNIENEISRLGLNGQVEMTGRLANPYPVIKNALAMILSSDYEGLPTVLLEAFVLSIPVVSVDCHYGPREILGDKYSQYLSMPGDEDELAANISTAVDNIRHNKLAVGPGHVAKFNIDNVANDYVRLATR